VLTETGTERDAFLAVVCADAAWVRAEFDAIVAASWDEPPVVARRPGRPAAAPVPAASSGFRNLALPAQRAVVACPARERSPPDAGLPGSSVWSSR
jgi:hypothetical protein